MSDLLDLSVSDFLDLLVSDLLDLSVNTRSFLVSLQCFLTTAIFYLTEHFSKFDLFTIFANVSRIYLGVS